MTVKKAWLLLPPGKPNSRDPATRALAFFNLVAPVVKPLHVRLWSAYIAQRKACNQRVRDLLNSGWCDGEAPCPMLDQIRQGYVHVLKGIAALDNDTQQRLADCITPWECDVSTNGNCEVSLALPRPISLDTSPRSPAQISSLVFTRRPVPLRSMCACSIITSPPRAAGQSGCRIACATPCPLLCIATSASARGRQRSATLSSITAAAADGIRARKRSSR